MCFIKFRYNYVLSEKSYTENINLERINGFTTTPNCNLKLLPFSKSGLLEYIKRAALQSGWYGKREKKMLYSKIRSIMRVGKQRKQINAELAGEWKDTLSN